MAHLITLIPTALSPMGISNYLHLRLALCYNIAWIPGPSEKHVAVVTLPRPPQALASTSFINVM